MFQVMIRRPWQAIVGAITLFALVLFMSRSHIPYLISSAPAFTYSPYPPTPEFNQSLEFQQIFVVSLPERTDRRDSMILAAALSNIKFEFIDAIHGDGVPDRAIPFGVGRSGIGDSNLGSWRAHMNAISEVVRRNLTTALILEDDADWDIRIKKQLYDFAKSLRTLIQPLVSDNPGSSDSTYRVSSSDASSASRGRDIEFDNLPSTMPPTKSPYGDSWELLWLGHCGMNFPLQKPEDGSLSSIPNGRVVRLNDPTVPETQHMYSVSAVKDLEQYPNQTRVISHAQDGICSLGYAVTQASARRLLYHLGVAEMTGPFDIMLKQFCDGTAGKGQHNCLTVRPGLFQHHRPVGLKAYDSDITDHGQEIRKKARSDNLRWPVRTNFEVLLAGKEDYVDQFPDTVG